jgi:hypothetical protein
MKAEEKKEMLMWEALRMATDEEMERDPTVCVMGTLRTQRNAKNPAEVHQHISNRVFRSLVCTSDHNSLRDLCPRALIYPRAPV